MAYANYSTLSSLSPDKLVPPKLDSKIVLTAQTLFGQARLNFYGPQWIVRRIEVYNPRTYRSSDPLYKFCGKLVLIISPLIDLPQIRNIGFPQDEDFSWVYLHDFKRTL